MVRSLSLALAVLAGAGASVQAPINAALGRDVGRFQAATVSFAAGIVVLIFLSLVVGGGFREIGSHPVPWHYVAGGVLGAIYVAVSLSVVRSLGVVGLTAAVITGQLTMALVLDRTGALGLERIPIAPSRIGGVALLVMGVVLVLRR